MTEKGLDDLLAKMTLKEKLGQLSQGRAYLPGRGSRSPGRHRLGHRRSPPDE